MTRSTVIALAGLVAIRAWGAGEPSIEIEAKFLEIPHAIARELPVLNLQKPADVDGVLKFGVTTNVIGGQRCEQLLHAVQAQKGVDLLSAPRVTIKPPQKSSVEVTREFHYPTEWDAPGASNQGWTPKKFETRHLGVMLEVEATPKEDGSIALRLAPQVSALLGQVDLVTKQPVAEAKPGEEKPIERTKPVFETQKAASTAAVRLGQSVVLILDGSDNTAPFASAHTGKTLVVLVTVRDGSTAPVIAKATPPPNNGLPVAIQVEGKPGFVRSPFSPEAGFVDVRGFAPGAQVRDPYSGKMFAVP